MRNLDRLRCFVAVAEFGNVRDAAVELGHTPSVVSQRVRQLEGQWGVVLFDRSAGASQLTSAGADLLERARRVVADVEALDRRASGWSGGRLGCVRIAYRHNTSHWVSWLGRELAARYPEVTMQFWATGHHDVVRAVSSGAADLGVAGPVGGLDTFELGVEPLGHLAVFSSHPLAAREEVTIADLEGEPFILEERNEDTSPREELLRELERCGVTPNFRLARVTAINDLLTLIGAETGMALLRSSSVNGDVPPSTENVRLVPVRGPVPALADVLIWDAGSASPAAFRCIELLRAESVRLAATRRL